VAAQSAPASTQKADRSLSPEEVEAWLSLFEGRKKG